jgi:DNA repair protein RecO (recombination protein O)
MRTYCTTGIVLRRTDLGEKDRILTIYTRSIGKVSAVAKGAKRPGSKSAGASEPLIYGIYLLSRGRDLDVVTQAEVKESFPNVRGNIKGIAYGIYLLELVNHFVDDRQPNPDIFDTLLSATYVLESGADPEIVARYFEIHLLDILGYAPQFEACLRCGKHFGNAKVAFSPVLGGIVCADCGIAPNDSIWVRGAVASYVRVLRNIQPNKIKDLNVPPGARRDLASTLKWHIRFRLERELKSVDFLESLRSAEP